MGPTVRSQPSLYRLSPLLCDGILAKLLPNSGKQPLLHIHVGSATPISSDFHGSRTMPSDFLIEKERVRVHHLDAQLVGASETLTGLSLRAPVA